MSALQNAIKGLAKVAADKLAAAQRTPAEVKAHAQNTAKAENWTTAKTRPAA